MKCIKFLSLSILGVLVLAGCTDRIKEVTTYTVNTPVYVSKADYLANYLSVGEPQELEVPGKIYYHEDILYVSETGKGIHVIDNKDPKNPQALYFIEIPGNADLAITCNTLYADSYSELVVIDLPSDAAPVIRGLASYEEPIFRGAFPSADVNFGIAPVEPDSGVVIGWQVEEITEERIYDSEAIRFGGCRNCEAFDASGMATSGGGNAPNMSAGSTGQSGSLARFTIKNNYLYTVSPSVIETWSLDNCKEPQKVGEVGSWTEKETVFLRDDQLFIGTTSGMEIYDISNPAAPEFISRLEHFTSCDPVVVDGDYAFVTLRSANNLIDGSRMCGQTNADQLDVVNISDIYQPYLVKTYEMNEPYGLGVDGNYLFICDGDAGLKVYDKSDVLAIDDNLLQRFKKIQAIDVIPLGDILLTLTADGIYQYRYDTSATDELEELSVFKY